MYIVGWGIYVSIYNVSLKEIQKKFTKHNEKMGEYINILFKKVTFRVV